RQEEALAGAGIPGLAGEVRRLAGAVAALPPALRLPVADLALPALRQLSPGQAGQLLGCLESLAVADRRITLFELCLQVQLRRRLRGTAAAAARPRPGRGEVRAHAAVLLSALARSGSPDPEVAARAFAVAARRLTGLLAPTDLRELGDEPATLLGPALEGLARAPLATRRAVLESASILVLSDRTVALEEAELVRAAAAALDLPLPGFADVA
ncbi:MAG: hypothetical protein FJ098_05970, partial [Deltaproteobacteria bacterium]|nr:hypothetical protein [Deltaproteobacteria bacterium]